jgi:hypothetical protein
MTRGDVAQRMWDFINSSPALNSSSVRIENAESRSIVEAYNAAIQEIAHYSPRAFFKQTRSSILRAPISSTLSVTENSTTFTDLLLTEDDDSKDAETPTASSTSAVFALSSHGFENGDIVRFTGSKPFTSSQEQFFVIQSATNEFRLSETFYGNQLTASSSGGFQIQKLKTIDPTGCSVDVGGDENPMRIKSIDVPKVHSFTARKRYTLSASHQLRFFIATTEDQVGDPDHVFNQVSVGDQILLQGFTGDLVGGDPAASHYNTTTDYYITRKTIDETGGEGISDVYGGYIDISETLDGNDPIPVVENQFSYMVDGSAGTYSFIKTSDKGKKSTGEFYEPYVGTTASVSATVYFDSIKLNSKVTEVLGTVTLNDESVLTPLMNNDQSDRLHRDRLNQSERFGEYGSGWELPSELQDKEGTPSYYYIDTQHDSSTNEQDYYMRLRPFPNKKARIRFTASVLPDKMPQKSAYSNTGNSEATGCPAEYNETILLPFVYKNFVKFIGFDVLPSEGSLQSGNILLQIDEDYRQAIEILKELEPQVERQAVYGVAW